MTGNFERPPAFGELTEQECEAVARYIAGSLSADERTRFERAILDDPRLAEAVYADANLRDAVGSAADDVTRARSRSSARWLKIALPAAAAILLAILSPRLFDFGGETNVPESTEGGRRLRSPVDSSPASPAPGSAPSGEEGPRSVALFPSGTFDEAPPFFKWTRNPDATLYRIEIQDEASALVFSMDTPETTVAFPPPVMASHAGTVLRWRIVPIRDGQELAPSEPLQFRVNR